MGGLELIFARGTWVRECLQVLVSIMYYTMNVYRARGDTLT